jgi:hypothetical protein
MNFNSVHDLSSELEDAITNFHGYHAQMTMMRSYYQNSAFYKRSSGAVAGAGLKTNLLKVFADKNIHYTSGEPMTKVPTTGSSEEQRQSASIREKIIYAVRRKSGTAQMRKKWAFDGTVFSAAVAETGFDLNDRCAFVRRYDPRFCFWQMSNEDENRVVAFWSVYPITADECEKRFGVRPTHDYLASVGINEDFIKPIDGKQWFTMAIRWDDKVKVAWCGDQFIEPAHNHMMGGIPIDICMPFDEADQNHKGAFYLEQLVPLQAELNDIIKQRSNIAKRMGNPTVWGRGIMTTQKDDITNAMATAGGGMVGLKKDGELGLLQVNDTRMLQEHESALIQNMMRISGFGAATFGETVGANTSGDALGMYFTPTERLIENQNISWNAFDESINAKILRAYDKFGKIGEKFNLASYSPAGTLAGISQAGGSYSSGGFEIEFDRTVIDGNYTNIVFPDEVTPKNDIANKRFWLDAAKQGVISRTTAYENMDIQSPEDELELLKAEQAEPTLNPDGTAKIMSTAMDYAQSLNPQLPTATPQPVAAPAIPAAVPAAA